MKGGLGIFPRMLFLTSGMNPGMDLGPVCSELALHSSRMAHFQWREPGFESPLLPFGHFRHLLDALLHSVKWMPGYRQRWKCELRNSLRAVIAAWLNASHRSRVGVGMNCSTCHVKCTVLWVVQRTGYCARYKNKPCLLLFIQVMWIQLLSWLLVSSGLPWSIDYSLII